MLSSLDINVDPSDGEITLSVPFKLEPQHISELINESNFKDIIYTLYNGDAALAEEVYKELKYWIEEKE